VYSDAPLGLDEHRITLSQDVEKLMKATVEALDEEAVLIAVDRVLHTT
jgi:hypothetical protein